MYAVRQGLEAVGMATPGGGGSAAGGGAGAPVAAVGANGDSGSAVATPSRCVLVFAERLAVCVALACASRSFASTSRSFVSPRASRSPR